MEKKRKQRHTPNPPPLLLLLIWRRERERLRTWREEIYLFKELDEIDTQLGSSQVFKLTFFCAVHFNTRNLIREAGLLFTLHQILELNSHSLETEMRKEEKEEEFKRRI